MWELNIQIFHSWHIEEVFRRWFPLSEVFAVAENSVIFTGPQNILDILSGLDVVHLSSVQFWDHWTSYCSLKT